MEANISSKKPRVLLLLFQILTIILAITASGDQFNKSMVINGIMLILLVYISNFILLKISSGDNYIYLIASMLMTIGLIMIYRLEPGLGKKQLIFVGLGIMCFFITYFIMKKIKIWDRYILGYIVLAYILFILTLIFGTRTYGAKNWISFFGLISVQPAEFIKLILIFILACYYGKKKENRFLSNTKYSNYSSYLIMFIIYTFIGLLFIQRDIGMAAIFYGVFFIIQYIFEDDRKLLLANIGLAIIGALLGYFLFNHVRVRINIWIDPWKYADTTGYQILQGLFSISEGGFFGRGLGLGYPQFIPLAYNDFIYPAIIEEMGIFMGIAIIMMYMIVVYRGFKIAIRQKDMFLKVIAYGVSSLFAIQSFVILGGVLNVIPLTGITLPFMAYGGTSMLSSYIALGLLQVASEDIEWSENNGKAE